jgi:EAL domain-containing protein (putative c-di-GMP-specific phosphodiesterase class I)
MVKAINQIGHTMNIRTIAEFVEDQETLQAVRQVGIDYAQGYAIARPAPIEIALFSDPVDAETIESDEPVQLKTATANS